MVVLFFFNDTATTEIYTLSLHDALPILRAGEGPEAAVACALAQLAGPGLGAQPVGVAVEDEHGLLDRKSTRLNSSHANISYAVFCLKKKKKKSERPSLATLVQICINTPP